VFYWLHSTPFLCALKNLTIHHPGMNTCQSQCVCSGRCTGTAVESVLRHEADDSECNYGASRDLPPLSRNLVGWNQRSRSVGARRFSESRHNSSIRKGDRSSIERSRPTRFPGAGDIGPSNHRKIEDLQHANTSSVSPKGGEV